MITKILLTLGVIAACIVIFSSKRPPESELRVIEDPDQVARKKRLQQGAFAMMGVMVLVAATMIIFETSGEPELVTVHVVNIQSGEKQSYKAVRDLIEANNFTTSDGRVIYLAGVERLEVEQTD